MKKLYLLPISLILLNPGFATDFEATPPSIKEENATPKVDPKHSDALEKEISSALKEVTTPSENLSEGPKASAEKEVVQVPPPSLDLQTKNEQSPHAEKRERPKVSLQPSAIENAPQAQAESVKPTERLAPQAQAGSATPDQPKAPTARRPSQLPQKNQSPPSQRKAQANPSNKASPSKRAPTAKPKMQPKRQMTQKTPEQKSKTHTNPWERLREFAIQTNQIKKRPTAQPKGQMAQKAPQQKSRTHTNPWERLGEFANQTAQSKEQPTAKPKGQMAQKAPQQKSKTRTNP